MLMPAFKGAFAIMAPIVAIAFPFTAQAQTPILIKFSHVVAPDTPKGKGAIKFKELAEKYTEGTVKVEIYPNSQLYKDNEEVDALQLGAVQMLAPSLSKFGPLGAREFEVFDLPYLFPDKETLRRVTDGPLGKELLRRLEDKGILGLAFWDNGFKILSANRRIDNPEDLLGLKMRIQSSKAIEAQMKALGALPQVMAFSEAYQALQTGVVDGTENPPSNMYTQKMHEVQKYATVTNHAYNGYALIANKKFWEGLPADVRGSLDRAVREATDYVNAIAQQENDAAMEAMRKAGTTEFHIPTPKEREAWIGALKPVHKVMERRIGRDLLEKVYKETGTAVN
jgi:C4-dicarboxylate-binding protein DctP